MALQVAPHSMVYIYLAKLSSMSYSRLPPKVYFTVHVLVLSPRSGVMHVSAGGAAGTGTD